jgi:hypothetical protein
MYLPYKTLNIQQFLFTKREENYKVIKPAVQIKSNQESDRKKTPPKKMLASEKIKQQTFSPWGQRGLAAEEFDFIKVR